jgi:hypothetical protein
MINSHAIIINADIEKVFQQALLWGEAEWWPKECLMRYTRINDEKGEGVIQVGSRYHQKVLLPFAPEWDVEIVSITPNKEVKRRFINGIFSGTDSVILEPVKDGIEVKALMDFEVNGYFNKLAWRYVFERMHNENVEKILRAMKGYFS